MPTPRTRPLPGWLLVLMPAAAAVAWVALIAVTWTFAVEDRTPGGGWFSLGLAFAATSTMGSLILWVLDQLRSHISAEVQTAKTELETTQPLPRLHAVGQAVVAISGSPEPLPDNVRSFELGRQVGRREQHDG